mgnify:CR=1 FL=1
MANVITICRILFSVVLLSCPSLSPAFYGLYLLAGATDMIDGTVARKMGTDSALGAKLDTVADVVFVAAAAYKLLPLMEIPKELWIWIGIIAAIKIINIASGFVLQKRFVTAHTVANKVTGILLFILPLSLTMVDIQYSSIAVCAMATFAAVQEGHFIRTGQVS